MKQKKTTLRNPIHQRRHCEQPERKKRTEDMVMNAADSLLDVTATEINSCSKDVVKTLEELYRAVSTAAAKLPDLEMHTDLLTVCNDDSGLSVVFSRDGEGEKEEDQFYDAN